MPSGTTLPSLFHLGPLRLNAFLPTAVEIFPSAPADALHHTGRKGVPLRESAGGRSLSLTFPFPVTRVVLELEPDAGHNLRYEAGTTLFIEL